MTPRIRPAIRADIRQLTELISATAGPISQPDLAEWMDGASALSAWHVAEDDTGQLIGLQWIGPGEAFPPEACEIATFVSDGTARMAAGSRLFVATAGMARQLGYDWIGASIDSANSGAQTYYQSRGFRRFGMHASKVLMRFDLD